MKRITVIIFVSFFILLKGYSQKIEIYEEAGIKYAAIKSMELPQTGWKIEVKTLTFIKLFNYLSTPTAVWILNPFKLTVRMFM